MMAHCWWAHSPNPPEIAIGVRCWPRYRSISIGAAMMQPIARHTCWAPGAARSRLRHCGKGAASAPCKVGGDKHPSLEGGPKVAHDATPRCRLGGIGMDIHMAHLPTRFEMSPWSIYTPCTPLRCYCRAATIPNVSTMPKVASVVNIPSHAWSSHSGEGMARAFLDEDDAWEDDFQTPHTPVCHVMQWEEDGHRCPAEGKPESSRGSPGQ